MSNFTSLHIGLTALKTLKQCQDIVGNNITNVSNENYKRREALIEPIRGADNIYGGVRLSTVKRIFDSFVEREVRYSIAEYEKNKALSFIISELEENLNVLNEGSLLYKLTEFWQSLEELSKNPQDITLRREIISKAKDFINVINSTLNKNYLIEENIFKNTRIDTEYINTKLKEISQLNYQIKSISLSGNDANSLKDIRDGIVDELSKYINIEIVDEDEGYRVMLNGITLVKGDIYFSIDSKTYEDKGRKKIDFYVKDFGIKINVSSGKLSAYKQALEDIEEVNLKVKNIINFLTGNSIGSFNFIHRNGYNLYGSISNKDFFIIDSSGKIDINPLIEKEPQLVAASKTPFISDGTNALELASFLKSQNLNGTSIFNYITEISSQVGYLSQQYHNSLDISLNIKNSLLNKREMISGVSLDEEIIKLIEIQKYYSIAAKYISISNDIIDEMIKILR